MNPCIPSFPKPCLEAKHYRGCLRDLVNPWAIREVDAGLTRRQETCLVEIMT